MKEGSTNLMNFGPVSVEPCETAIFNYTFVNTAEQDASIVTSQLTQQAIRLADSGVQTVAKDIAAGVGITRGARRIGLAPAHGEPPWDSRSLADEATRRHPSRKLRGVVAVEQIVKTGNELNLGSRTTIHNGGDSNVGCGKNSQYEVAWSITSG